MTMKCTQLVLKSKFMPNIWTSKVKGKFIPKAIIHILTKLKNRAVTFAKQARSLSRKGIP